MNFRAEVFNKWNFQGRASRCVTLLHLVGGELAGMNMRMSKLWDLVMGREAWRAAILGIVVGQDWATEQQQQQKDSK